MRGKMLIFGSPRVESDEINEVVDSLLSGWLSTGPKVARFEDQFRQYIGCRHALAVSSCTAGLHLALIALGIGPGDEVITTPMTFAATANVIIHAGATPVFVDISLPSMTIDPDLIEAKITPRTKAIIPVHLAGRPCDMDAILDIAGRHHLRVIEDAAHAVEAVYHGRKVGDIGDIGCFSFYVTKNVVTGEGGMVTTRNDEWAEKIQVYALHGLSKGAWRRFSDEGYKHYTVMYPGYKYNMMDLQAALGIHQLARVDRYLAIRERIWTRYDAALADLPVVTPADPAPDTVHARHLYTLLLDIDCAGMTRDAFQQRLFEKNIGTGVHFVSLHLHPFYRDTYGYRPEDYPNASEISRRTVSLPLSAKLTDDDVEDVIGAVRDTLA